MSEPMLSVDLTAHVLAGILGFAQLLDGTTLSAEQRRYLRRILEGSHRLKEACEDARREFEARARRCEDCAGTGIYVSEPGRGWPCMACNEVAGLEWEGVNDYDAPLDEVRAWLDARAKKCEEKP